MSSTPILTPEPPEANAGAACVAGTDADDRAASPGNRLVEAWQAGGEEEEIFRRIFNTYYRKVYSFFSKRGFPADECHDLAQETFLKVLRGLPAFRREARFETWLFQIAANLYRNTLRSQSTQKREAQEVSLDEGGEAEIESADSATSNGEAGALSSVLAEERSRVLNHALAELPSQMRRCVELRVHQDLRYREIAELMQVSIDTVKAHLYQARQQLKSKLSGYFADLEI